MESTSYKLEGLGGEVGTDRQSSATYTANSGLEFVQMSNTPAAPTLVNTANWYDKLHITLLTSNNPTDTTFAVAISKDDFVTTQYVQNDGTIGGSLGIEDYRTYAAWGGVLGDYILGLDNNTPYKVKVKARQGLYTETPWGPISTASTDDLSITMDIDVAASDTETSPPYNLDVGDMQTDVVAISPNRIWVDFSTNAYGGGVVFVRDNYGGLYSTTNTHTIPSATADLDVVASGYGVQGVSAAQSSGGPLSILAPYNDVSNNVGIIDTTFRPIFATTQPVVSGRVSFQAKAKINSAIPAADDYSDALVVI